MSIENISSVEYLSKQKYSEFAGISETKIKQLIDEGKLPHFQSTKKYHLSYFSIISLSFLIISL